VSALSCPVVEFSSARVTRPRVSLQIVLSCRTKATTGNASVTLVSHAEERGFSHRLEQNFWLSQLLRLRHKDGNSAALLVHPNVRPWRVPCIYARNNVLDKSLILLVPGERFELPTNGKENRRSGRGWRRGR
jgi:hypothetical protein